MHGRHGVVPKGGQRKYDSQVALGVKCQFSGIETGSGIKVPLANGTR